METEAEAEAEAEAETTLGAAAAAAAGGVATVSAGDFARTSGEVSIVTSTSTSDVKDPTPAIFTEAPDDEQTEQLLFKQLLAKNLAIGEADECKGLFEAEAEAEAEAEVEAEADNNAAAVAAVASGTSGANGIGASSRSASATSASTSTEKTSGTEIRNNDVVDAAESRFEDLTGQDEASASAGAEAEAETSNDLANAAASSAANGDAEATSQVALDDIGASIKNLSSPGAGTPTNQRSATNKNVDGGQNLSPTGNLGSENELEAEAEAEAEIGYLAAAAGAAATASQGQNSLIPLPANASAATASSTSVSNRAPNNAAFSSNPGPATDADFGELPMADYDLSQLVLVTDAEAEAEAEVGFEAAGASAAAAAAGFEGMKAQTSVSTNLYAAAAAAGSGEVVTLTVSIPAEGEAGDVIAEATARDAQGRSVAAAVAVAGVPFEDFQDNEAEAEQEGEGMVTVSVTVQTDPRDARNPRPLAIGEDSPEEENRGGTAGSEDADPGIVLVNLEAEAEAESEVEVGYGTAAASAAAASTGIGAVTAAETSTSTDKYKGGYNFTSAARIKNISATNEDGMAVIQWTAAGVENFAIDQFIDGEYQQVGSARGSVLESQRHYQFKMMDATKSVHGEFRVRDLADETNRRTVMILPAEEITAPYPNPFHGALRLPIAVSHDQQVTVTIRDLNGKMIGTIYDAKATAEKTKTITWAPENDLTDGLYVVHVAGEDFSRSYRMVYRK